MSEMEGNQCLLRRWKPDIVSCVERLDVLRLESRVHALRAEAVNYVWSLWEDPSYLAEMALELGEHCGQPISFASGKEVSKCSNLVICAFDYRT